jgi:hypothetical protein
MTKVINLLENKKKSLPYIDYSIGTYQKYMLANIHISTNHPHLLLGNTCFSATENEYFYSKILEN